MKNLVITIGLITLLVSCKNEKSTQFETETVQSLKSPENAVALAEQAASPEVLNTMETISAESPNQSMETITFSEGAIEKFDQTQPQPRDFYWKWIDCKDSNMPTSPASTNVVKGKTFTTPWYDPINVYIVSNAAGTIGQESEEIYFVDRRRDQNGNYRITKHSSLTELKCGIWGNLGFADQAIIYFGSTTKQLEMTITKVNDRFYVLKATSKLTGKPIEMWLWKR